MAATERAGVGGVLNPVAALGQTTDMSVPEAIGRLRRVERIGSGGFATVWRYHDAELDSDVAVKALADNWTTRLDIRERFLEEARILRRADSDHVVRVHDIGETPGGTPYFVMTYADRGTVADLLEQERLPTVEQTVELVRQAGAGLAVLHRTGIIHRDIKPQNLLLRSRRDAGPPHGGSDAGGIGTGGNGTGGNGTGPAPPPEGLLDVDVLVADLGVAKAAAHASGLTQVVGTPAYIAPEQALGTGLDVRADVHALGAVTYVLLTGRLVREDGLGALVEATLPPAPSAVADLPATLDPVVLRALAPDPADRWPDVDRFVDALVRAAAGEWVPEAEPPARAAAGPAAADEPAGQPARRGERVRVAALVLLVLVLSFAASFLLVSRWGG